MGHDDLGSSPSEEQIQPPLKKKSKLGEKSDSKSESKGEKKNDDVRKLEGKREKEGVSMDVRVERLRKAISKSEESYLCPGEDSVDYEKWIRYFDQLRESESFDINLDDFPAGARAASVVPLRNIHDTLIYSKLCRFATKALDEYNSHKGENYALKDIVKVNRRLVGGGMYYITFEAYSQKEHKGKSPNAKKERKARGAAEIFQARVFARTGLTEVDFCRRKHV